MDLSGANATKICNKCSNELSLDNYSKNKRNKDGKDYTCKDCTKIRNSQNKEKNAESVKKWREKNPDYMKKYGQSDKSKEYHKQYYKENSQVYKDRKKEWRAKNPEKEKEARTKYREENKEKMNEYHRKWKENKRYIGCAMEELKEYLSTKLTNEMTWENYGSVWHIDHIIPCSSWDFSSEFESSCCWNFRNLQPMLASENQSKHDNYNEEDKNEYIKRMEGIFNST
jgi:hypothetical protein